VSPFDEIYRAEAVVRQLRPQARPPATVRASPAWIRLAYWAALAGVAVTLAGLGFTRVDEYAVGSAIIQARDRCEAAADAGSYDVIATFPGRFASRLHSGMSMALRLHGDGNVRLEVIVASVEPLASGSEIVVRAVAPARALAGRMPPIAPGAALSASAEAAVRSEPLIASMVPALKSLMR
jgi:hypothetical protein